MDHSYIYEYYERSTYLIRVNSAAFLFFTSDTIRFRLQLPGKKLLYLASSDHMEGSSLCCFFCLLLIKDSTNQICFTLWIFGIGICLISQLDAYFADNNNTGSDSDSNSIDESQDYYEPISAVDLDNANDIGNDEEDNYHHPIGGDGFSHGLSNGHCMIPEPEEGISSISINEHAESEQETETETESEIRRAFEEDERRRRSPLVAENAVRVMEAMRAISFPGTAPDWASDINEDRWIDQLRRLRSTSLNN